MNENEPIYNIFEALECENPERLMAKAQLSVMISELMEARRLDDATAAKLFGWGRRRIKRFHRREFDDIGLDDLFDMLKALGYDVIVNVQPATEPTAHLRVVGV